ncbi:adenylate/guanylate cyclase domain-containing protein (plasmid) [Microvirga terrae]|uniref:Adenylate/guanylate cyclase domain-containing protein n=1 Tax=Microvirga terrae TaxID=2740529 RepID=A0ABY5RZR3_9HYPH|nr:adenylate/guanylate cyclase domain-containing protein [Microvirga terrae]UVF22721.1 adenylate/guanylate cyclase domain-containing protein [Microvirga terrae]
MADIVGYSRLVERDENGTLAAIKTLRREIIHPLLIEHHGRIVKLMGDGAIAEFGSVVDAATFTIRMQQQVTAAQTQVSPDRRIVFRIGINLGDVVVEDGDLLGDGVNVAARLEQLCDPGGVLISGTAYDHLHGKLELPLEFTGEQHVKNISRPVRIYRIRLDGRLARWRPKLTWPRQWHVPTAALAALAGLAGGAFLWGPPEELQVAAALVERAARSLSDDPSIADNLIADLLMPSSAFAIAGNLRWDDKGKPSKVQKVAAEPGVRYVLKGSVRRMGDHLRINAKLNVATSGRQRWVDREDVPFGAMFAFQDEGIGQIVAALAMEFAGDHQARIADAETELPIARNDPRISQVKRCMMPRTLTQGIGLLNLPTADIDARLMEIRRR